MHPEKLNKHQIPLYLDTRIFNSNNEFCMVDGKYHDETCGYPIDMHEHNFYEINIICEGDGYHYIANQCFPAVKGSVFVIPPRIYHGYYTECPKDFKIFNIIICSTFIEKYHDELENLPGYSTLFEIEPQLRKEAQNNLFLTLSNIELTDLIPYLEILCHKDNNSAYDNISSIGTLFTIISKLTSSMTNQHKKIMDQAINLNEFDTTFILKSMEYIHNNLREKITIDKLASMVNMSRATYIRYFEKATTKSPNNYITDVRIRQACSLLKHSLKSISEISYECGFFDTSHFTKTFVKFKHKMPKQYRDDYLLKTESI